MNVEKTAKNKPLIPQKFLQSIMFLLCMRHTTTAMTYKFLSLLFTLISNSWKLFFVTGNPIFITGNPVYVTGNSVFITGNPVFITEHPVFITENYWT